MIRRIIESISTVYDAANRPILTTDALGVGTAMRYDDQGNVISTTVGITSTSALRLTTLYTYTYDVRYPGDTQLQMVQSPDGVVTRYEYNEQGLRNLQRVGFDTPLEQVTIWEYDDYGRVTATITGLWTPAKRRDETHYTADGSVDYSIQNYDDGIFDAQFPDQDIRTSYGYDVLGRQIWMQDALGHYTATRYQPDGRVEASVRNLTPLSLDAQGQPVIPSYDPAHPDQNVSTWYGYDGLGRTVLVTETGILSGSFNPQTLTFSDPSSRVTRTEYDSLSRPVTVTLNYRPELPVGSLPDVNLQTITRYDGVGNPIWQRDALGRWTKTEYDALNRTTKVIANYQDGNPNTAPFDTDRVSVTVYDRVGRVDKTIANYSDGVFNPNQPDRDRITTMVYDPLGRVTSTIQNWHPASLTTRTDTNLTTSTAYDAQSGRVLGSQDTLGRWQSQLYDGLGRVETSIQNCRDSAGNPVSSGCAAFDAQQPDRNLPSTTHYDALGRAFEQLDAENHVQRTLFDGLGRSVTSIQNYVDGDYDPQQTDTDLISQTHYDTLGQVISTTDAANQTTSMQLNGLGQTVVLTDTMNRVTTVGYDGQGSQRWNRDHAGTLTVTQLDGLGRVIGTIINYENGLIDPMDGSDRDLTQQTMYDAAGRVLRQIAPGGQVTQFAYDNLDRLIAVTENAVTGTCSQPPCNVITSYGYDWAGNRLTITDANQHQRSFQYDAADRQVASIDALNQATRWDYDKGGRVLLQHDPRGTQYDVSYSYDELDRATQLASSQLDAPITTSYSAGGQRASLTDGTGTTNFGYDALGRMTSVEAPQTGTVGYGYDARGLRTQLTYPDSTVVDYQYFPDGQLQQVSQNGNMLATYGYSPTGQQLAFVERANGASTSYGYDGAGRLTDLHTQVSGSTTTRFQYTLNRAGLRQQVVETLPQAPALPAAPASSPTAAPQGLAPQGSGHVQQRLPAPEAPARFANVQTQTITPTLSFPDSFVDDLTDRHLLFGVSTNLGFDTSNAEYFGDDSSRLRRDDTNPAWAIWHLEGMSSFRALSYHASWEPVEDFSFLSSSDGVTFTPITPTLTITTSAIIQRQSDLSLPAGTNYVKVVYPTGSSAFWNPQLGQVRYERPALPPADQQLNDSLDDLSQVVVSSTNLGFDSSNSGAFHGDESRLRPHDTSGGWAVWQLTDMDSFIAVSYHAAWLSVAPLSFLASADGISYVPVTPTLLQVPGDWVQSFYDLRLPDGTKYVKVLFPAQSDFWAMQLGQVAYRSPMTVLPSTPTVIATATLEPATATATLEPATATPLPTTQPSVTPTLPTGTGTGLQGVYFSDLSLGTAVLTRTDTTVDFGWAADAPDASLPSDGFSVRWTGQLEAPVSGRYGLRVRHDDRMRLWLNGQLLVDEWNDDGLRWREVWVSLSQGQRYDLSVAYADASDDAELHLEWWYDWHDWATIPSISLYPSSGPIPPTPAAGNGNGLRFTLYQDAALSIPRIMAESPLINFDWGNGPPDGVVPGDGFSVRWDGQLQAPVTGMYTMSLTLDGGARLWVGNQPVLDDWDSDGLHTVSGQVLLEAQSVYDLRLEYRDPAGASSIRLNWASVGLPDQVIPRSALFFPALPAWQEGQGSGLSGQYFSERTMTTPALRRRDASLDWWWGAAAPDAALPADGFSVRWSGRLTPLVTDRHGLALETDGAVKLWLNGQLLIDDPDGRDGPTPAAGVDLVAGQRYDLVIEYVHDSGDAWLTFTWAAANLGHYGVQTSQLTPAVLTSTRTITYQYDGLQRLTSAEENPGTTQTYAYDLAGNRSSVWVNGTQTQSLSYNAANQVVGWSYDAAGNLLNDGSQSYTYDALNRVLSVGSTSNQYNGDGTLVAQTQNSVTTRYVQDLAAPLSQILSDASTGSAQAGTQRYVYGAPAERLFAQQNTMRTWYSVDALNSVRALLDDAGIPQDVANYDAWGVPETAAIAPFGFTGELQRGNDVWLRARWYGAGRGGFGARDPFAGWGETPYSLQYYQYAYSVPTMWTDASGRCVDQPGRHDCDQHIDALESYGFYLDDRDGWSLREIKRLLEAIDVFRQGAQWPKVVFRQAMTHDGVYSVIASNDMPRGTGTTYKNQSQQRIYLRVNARYRPSSSSGVFSIIHEFAHVWDSAEGGRFSAALKSLTGGRYSWDPHRDDDGTLYLWSYQPGCPTIVPKGYYGRAAPEEDWAETVAAVVVPALAFEQPRERDSTGTQLFIDADAAAGGRRKGYVRALLESARTR